MLNICVFAGTTEGRKIIEFLAERQVAVTACVATEYGGTLLKPSETLRVSARPMPKEEIRELLTRQSFDLVIDATHPYAVSITESVAEACRSTGTEYLRLLREESAHAQESIYVRDADEAVAVLDRMQGNILLTTGSKELRHFAAIRDFEERVYARVLPMPASLALCAEAGVKPSHMIAMQGPFSEELNVAMLHAVNAACMVTKDGGSPGGIEEKIAACKKAGVKLLVIGRPSQREGISLEETIELLCRRFSLEQKPEVAIIGIGPGSSAYMTGEAREAIDRAQCLIGAERMLKAACAPGKPGVKAIAPEAIAEAISAHREYRRFAVLMSGDVGFFSGAKKLLPRLKSCEVRLIPGISSLVYLCAKLQRSYEEVLPLSLHGRRGNLVGQVRANAAVFVLLGGANTVNSLCACLIGAGLGAVKLSVGERLGYPEEKISRGTAEELHDGVYDSLSAVLIENPEPQLPALPSLPDDAFLRGEGEKGGIPMTKSEVRAVCLSKLRLKKDSLCWDVGAGTGSVSIEMAAAAPEGEVYAIERDEAAAALTEKNVKKFGQGNVKLIRGTAPQDCAALPAPSHVFIGGSAGNLKSIIAAALEKNASARIVATAVTLESAAELSGCIGAFDFAEHEVVLLTVARDKKLGNYHLMGGQNPVYIFTMQGGGGRA